MEPGNDFTLDALENLEPLVNPVRQYRNRSKKKEQQYSNDDKLALAGSGGAGGNSCKSGGDEKLAEVLAKIASLQKTSDSCIDRTKLVRTYNVKLRLKKTSLYKCFDCDSCFTNADFLELHEKSHATSAAETSPGSRQDEIDLSQEQSFDEMNLKQNAWFPGDFYDAEQMEDDDGMIQLDCTVEEREDNFDITFDRTKCEKTYTVMYKVKKEPVGKCERCDKLFYTGESLELHKQEHERFMDFDAIEPKINIDSPKIEESTLMLDECFYQALSEMDSSDILEVSESTIDAKLSPTAAGGFTFEYKIVPRRASKEHQQQPSAGDGSPSPPVDKQQAPRKNPPSETIEGKFQCDICAKRFRFRPALNVHVRTHDNSRPFRCPECGRTFISRAKLFLHAYGHARERRAAGLRCDGCGEAFARPRQLLEHLQRGHISDVENQQQRRTEPTQPTV